MKTTYRYLIVGILFGLCFPIAALLIDTIVVKGLSPTLSNLGSTFQLSFLHAIIATAPLFLGLAFYIAGRKAENLSNQFENLNRVNDSLKESNAALDQFNYEVTHELKSSMIEVESLAKMLRKHANNDSRREEIVSRLIRSAQKGTRTVNSFSEQVQAISDAVESNNNGNSDTDESQSTPSVKQVIESFKEQAANTNQNAPSNYSV